MSRLRHAGSVSVCARYGNPLPIRRRRSCLQCLCSDSRAVNGTSLHPTFNKMSINYLTADQLSQMQRQGLSNFSVVDVRDGERAEDGHIQGSIHAASSEFQDRVPGLLEQIKGKDNVIFHCHMSQVRGPTCAKLLARHLERAERSPALTPIPEIYVLDQGFSGWQSGGRPVCKCKGSVCTELCVNA